MANPEHVEIVKQGAGVVASWRAEQPNARLDLQSADLKDVDMSGADLGGAVLARAELVSARLVGANLAGADLEDANLAYAKLDGAVLTKAKLHAARLVDASLEKASLVGAEMSEAILDWASLESADLEGANLAYASLNEVVLSNARFEETRFRQTILSNIDLTKARGLEAVVHEGPSLIDERTLRKSWPLPEVFLRGIGLSDQYIEYLPSLMGQAIEFYSCFISYSSKDDEFAHRLHADLQAEGVRCWFAPEDLRIGDKFRTRIDEAIRLHDKLLLILSEESVQSTWVENEVESAFEKEDNVKKRGEDRTVLFPIRLDSAVMETDAAWAANIRRTRHIGDFSAWKDHDAYQESFQRLLRDLKSGATKD